jgi:diaminopimelate decarboxylase
MQSGSLKAPLPFGTCRQFEEIVTTFGTPLYVHDENSYLRHATDTLAIPHAFGLTIRYAMKANSHSAVLKIFDRKGIQIDASSIWEVKRAVAAGVVPDHIMLTGQEVLPAEAVRELVEMGTIFCSTSLAQLRIFCDLFKNSEQTVSVRLNPGLGSGHNNRTSTAGPAASFGIWYEYLPDVIDIANNSGLKIGRVHTHVGSGSDWRIWQRASSMTLDLVRKLPDVTIVNLGGGYKIDRMDPKGSINLTEVFSVIKKDFERFARETGRKLHLEIEPGTWLSANSCVLVARVNDIVDTGAGGYTFLKADASMTELLRPMMYGARHPVLLPGGSGGPKREYLVVGMCCESGDIFTVKEADPEAVATIELPEAAVGDILVFTGAGAYCNAMSVKNYNSRPACAEVMLRADGRVRLITRRQEPKEMWGRELEID